MLDPPFYIGPGCRVEGNASVGPDTVLVSGVVVAPGAQVRDSVIWKNAAIGPDAEVTGALIGPGVRVGRKASVDGSLLGEGSSLSDYSRTS